MNDQDPKRALHILQQAALRVRRNQEASQVPVYYWVPPYGPADYIAFRDSDDLVTNLRAAMEEAITRQLRTGHLVVLPNDPDFEFSITPSRRIDTIDTELVRKLFGSAGRVYIFNRALREDGRASRRASRIARRSADHDGATEPVAPAQQ